MSTEELADARHTDERPSKKTISTKRKRSSDAAEDEAELEIDVNAPEPPSKKAKRKEKKARKDCSSKKERSVSDHLGEVEGATKKDVAASTQRADAPAAQKNERSDYGVWIGNLAFTTTKDDVRRFLSEQGEIAETQVTRVHMPAPADGKSKNKGFAYVDFTTSEMLNKALSLSEKLLAGRKLLIKNAKSFEGRPEKPKAKEENSKEKEPTKRVFVGNLGFDVTREELAEHFSRAGDVEDVFLATFEDSGKCKGFGWVRFLEVAAAEAAVKGFVKVNEGQVGEGEDEDGEPEIVTEKGGKKKKSKFRKVFINRRNGRPLRCEFAEDAQTRYKKRYGKERDASAKKPQPAQADIVEVDVQSVPPQKSRPKRKSNADDRREDRRKRHDARTIAPGQSLANAPRASAAIVAGSGKKISFD